MGLVKNILIALLTSVIVLFGFTFFKYKLSGYSPDQNQIIKMYGNPSQFLITYLPVGENSNELFRSEVWFYPKLDLKVSFLGGDIYTVEEYKSGDDLTPTSLKPKDFHFGLNYKQTNKKVGKDSFKLDFIPGNIVEKQDTENQELPKTSSNAVTYMNQNALFIIESDNLSFIQTTGIGNAENTGDSNSNTEEGETSR